MRMVTNFTSSVARLALRLALQDQGLSQEAAHERQKHYAMRAEDLLREARRTKISRVDYSVDECASELHDRLLGMGQREFTPRGVVRGQFGTPYYRPPHSIDDIVEAMVKAGLVERCPRVRGKRGRPPQLYRLTRG